MVPVRGDIGVIYGHTKFKVIAATVPIHQIVGFWIGLFGSLKHQSLRICSFSILPRGAFQGIAGAQGANDQLAEGSRFPPSGPNRITSTHHWCLSND